MNINNKQGFSLIEVLVALVIVAVGAIAGSTLLGILFENSSNAQSRRIATSLAQRKLDDLRSYTEIVPSTGKTWTEALADSSINMAYQFIEPNKGGLIESGEQTVIENSNTAYTLEWDVVDYGYFNTDGNPTTPEIDIVTTADIPDYKLITVTAGWTDQKGDPQSIELTSNISATMANGAEKLALGEVPTSDLGGPAVKLTTTLIKRGLNST